MANKVLVIMSSVIPEEKSYSTALWKRFIKHYHKFNPQDEIIYLDLNKEPMAQKTMTRQNYQQYFNSQDSDKYINQLKTVNKVVVSSQMMNFNIPGMLKNYIDHVWVADKTFSYKYSKQGDAIGLLKDLNTKVQILATQGAPLGWYPWGDHVGYLVGTFKFIGCKVTKPLLVDGTKTPENNQKTPEQRIDEFDAKIKQLAAEF